MYVKYLVNRIKNASAKAWTEWKSFRNYPGMEYRDVHNVMPKSHMWKFPSPGSIKYEKYHNEDYFKWDFKVAYRDSIYFVRRLFPDAVKKMTAYTGIKITNEDMEEFSKRHPNWNEYASKNNFKYIGHEEKSIEERHSEYESMIENMFETKNIALEFTGRTNWTSNVYKTYFPVYDAFGTDKNVDPSDMDSKYLYIYFDNLQMLHDYDTHLKEENNYQRDVYVGRTKAWQVLPDFYGKDQVDKIQAAIGAPLQDQLDEWEEGNVDRKMQMPITNENMHKFRGVPDHFENLDHDYERILYERQKNQRFEQMRNTRYEELITMYYKNNVIEH